MKVGIISLTLFGVHLCKHQTLPMFLFHYFFLFPPRQHIYLPLFTLLQLFSPLPRRLNSMPLMKSKMKKL